MDSFLELNCSTQSHCAPEYYAKLVSLHFVWFLNNTKLTNEYNSTLRRHVSRGDRNSQYSCIIKKDTVESDRSDPVQINLLCKSQSSDLLLTSYLYSYASFNCKEFLKIQKLKRNILRKGRNSMYGKSIKVLDNKIYHEYLNKIQ